MHTADLFDPEPITRAAARQRAHQDAKARAELGMARAADKADRANTGWCGMALHALRAFAKAQAGFFTIEIARSVLEEQIPKPPEARAWGQVVKQASRLGYIERTGQSAPACSSNGSHKPLWKKGTTV